MLSALIDKIIQLTPPAILAKAIKFIPTGVFEWKGRAQFRAIVRYAYKNSKFYRRKFDELRLDPSKVKKPSDLGSFYTTPLDIVEHAEDFLCKKPGIVFESSGTTGRNKRLYFGYDELNEIGRLSALGYFAWGLKPDSRVANAFDFCIWIPGMVAHKGLEQSKFFCLDAGKVDPIEVYKRIPVYNIDVIMGEPTWLIKLTEIAEKNGSYPLKYIITGAENMPQAARPWMEKVWQGARILMTYASVESGGAIGAEICPECDGYHIDENGFLVEIADPDAEGYGEVVFTTLDRKVMPLIRYRNKDISKIISDKCSCGIKFRRLARMRGRGDEMVVASGGNLYPLMFENILKDIEGITSDWQVVFSLRDIKEIMTFDLELRQGQSADAVKEKVLNNIRDRYPDLWKNYSIAIFEIDFAFHSPGALREGKHKLLRIVDKRYAK